MSSQGGTLTFFYMYVGSGYFLGFKILNFNILGFSKKIIFLGYEDFVDIFLGCHHIIGLYLVVISMHFRVFS